MGSDVWLFPSLCSFCKNRGRATWSGSGILRTCLQILCPLFLGEKTPDSMVPWQSFLQDFNMYVSLSCPSLLCIRKSLSSHCSVTSFTLMFNCGCTVLLLLTALIPLHKVASLFSSFYPLNSCLSATDLLACLLCQTQEKSQSVFPFTWHLRLIPILIPSLAFCILLCLF